MKKLFILAVAVLAIVAVAVPALAAAPGPSFTLGLRALTDIGWWQRSKELTGTDDTGTWFINMPGHSYLVARFYNADKTVGGRVEFGIKSNSGATAVDMRYLYGWWRVGNCRLLAGHTDNWFGSLAYHPMQYVGLNNNAHLLLFGWGLLWPHRVPQVQFTYNTASWGVQFALEEPRQNSNLWGGTTTTYYTFPRASLTFMFKAGSFMTHPGINYVKHQYQKADGSTTADDSYDTWAVVLPIKFSVGAFTLKFQGHYGINFGGEYPFYPTTTGGADTRPLLVGGDVKDTTILGGMISGEFAVGKAKIVGGFGYERFQNDDGWTSANGYSKDENTRWGAFIAVPYQVTKNFGIHPEFSYYNWGDKPKTGADMGTEWILGVEFRFIF